MAFLWPIHANRPKHSLELTQREKKKKYSASGGRSRSTTMMRLKRLASPAPEILTSRLNYAAPPLENNPISLIPSQHPSRKTSNRFLDFYQLGNKAAIEKERARLADEMTRGYFADMKEMKTHGGKIAMASKSLIPVTEAVKFPAMEANYPDGSTLKLPIVSGVPKATLLCVSFRANSLAMVDSWSIPFLESFRKSDKVQIYEVSFIDSWLLSHNPVKWLLLRMMRKSKPVEGDDVVQRQIAYSFGDHYYFRKELKILNLLSGYIFLLDNLGRIRWQGFGLATPEEVSSLLSCTSLLLQEK